jgi:hypothetical protein
MPCCHFDEQTVEARAGEPQALFHGAVFEKMRQDMRDGKPVDGCKKCQWVEGGAPASARTKSNARYRLDPQTARAELLDMELSLGNLCNLTCRSCNDLYSSAWLKLRKKLYPNSEPQAGLWQFDTDILTDELLEKLESLYLIGGEPLLNPEFDKILGRLVAVGNLRCKIAFSTNGTRPPSANQTKLLSFFPSLEISLSVDGYGEQNEILRPPSRWSQIESVARVWCGLLAEQTDWRLALAMTISAYNALSVPALLRWWQDISPPAEGKYAYANPIVHPAYLRPGVLPAAARTEIKRRLSEQTDCFQGPNKQNILRQVCGALDVDSERHFPEFLEFNRRFDEVKGVDTFGAFHELRELLADVSK